MKRLARAVPAILIALLVPLVVPAQASEIPESVLDVKNNITGERIVSYIDFLASEYCRGRETGDYGMEVAAKYITSILKGAGLQAAGEYGGFYQYVDLKELKLSKDSYLRVDEGKGGSANFKTAKLEWDYLPISISAEKEVSAPLVFAGYGISAPDHNYDDYDKLNVDGKIVLLMRHEPGEKNPDSPFDGRKLSDHGTLLAKIKNAQDHGAIGVIFVTDPLNHSNLSSTSTSGTYWPSLSEERMKDDEDFKYMRFRAGLKLVGQDFGVRIPAIAIDSRFAEHLLGDSSLEEIQEKIDASLAPGSFLIPDKKISMGVTFDTERVDAFNIVAKVTGSDPELKNEVIVVGAHYDHEGKDNRGRVYFGADDNASGTAGVMELARAFQSLDEKPKRTLVFILFTAEEKGLLGSRYYVDHPVYPLEDTIAMLNLDMIGRNDVDQISVLGKYQYPKLYEVFDGVNKAGVNLEVNFSVEQFVRNSDQFPFMREGIPSIFLNSGTHDQLHRPEDTVDRILPDKTEKVVQLAFLSLWKMANMPAGTDFSEEGGQP